MTRPLKLDINGDAAGARRTLDEAARAVDHLRRETDRLEGEFRDARQEAAKLDKQLLETKAAAAALGREFARTNDKSLLTQIEAHNKAATEIKRVQATIVGDSEKRAKESSKAWKNAFDDLIKDTKGFDIAGAGIPLVSKIAENPALAVGVGAAGAGAAIPLLAGLGGATIAAGGAGVAGLGIAGAVLGNPQQFKTAWGSVLTDVKRQFTDASAPFVGPTMDALRTIGPLVRSWHIDEIFANASRFVEPIVHGLEGFGSGLMGGVSDLVKNGAPAIEALSDGMIRLGEAAGNALSSISSESEGGAMALHDLVTVVALAIEGFGKLVEGAEFAYRFMREHPWMTAAYTGGLSLAIAYVGELDDTSSRLGTTELGLRKAAEEAGHAFSEQGDDLTVLTQQLNTTRASVDQLAANMVNKLFSATMGLDQATLGFNQSLTQLGETFNKHDHSIDIHTKKGQENVQAIYASVTANMELYQSMVTAGATAEQAAAAYSVNTQALESQLRKAGLTSAEIDNLIGKYRNVPNRVNTELAMQGLTNAINGLEDVLRLINHLPPRKDVWVVTHYGSVGGKEGPAKYATGTRSAPPGLAWVGESGPELMSMAGGERVFTPTESARLMSNYMSPSHGLSMANMVGGGRSQPMQVVIQLTGGSDLDRAVVGHVMKSAQVGLLTLPAKAVA